MIADHSDYKKFRVVDNLEDKVMHEFLSWIRFVEYDENITLIYQYQSMAISKAQKQRRGDDSDSDDEDPSKGFKAKDLPPLSIRNEKRVLQRIIQLSKELLDKYPRTYEEDLKELERTDLTFNQSNSLLYTSGEKVILNFLINSCQKMLPLLDMEFKVTITILFNNVFIIGCKKDSRKRLFIRFMQRLHQ